MPFVDINHRKSGSRAVPYLAVLALASVTRADLITYTVDASRSNLAISGSFSGNPLQPGADPGQGLIASYTGTITVLRNPVAGSVQLIGATITAKNAGSFSPPLISLPANYGFFTPLFQNATTDPVLTEISGAIRSFSFSLSSPEIENPTGFDPSILSVGITSGTFDYATSEFPTPGLSTPATESDGSSPLAGNLALASGTAGFIDLAGIDTLTVPFDTNLTADFGGSPLTLHLSGSIVAVVPEPSSLVTLGIPLGALILRRRRDP